MSASAGVHHVTGGPARDRAGGDLGTSWTCAPPPICRSAAKAAVASTTSRSARPTTRRKPKWSPCSRRKGSARPSRSTAAVSVRPIFESRTACCSRSRPTIRAFTVDEPKEVLGNAIKLPPWYESRRAEIVAGAASASLIAGAAKRRSARRWSRQILFCAPGAGLIPSPRARSRSNYVCAEGCEGNEAFIVGGYRREYWR